MELPETKYEIRFQGVAKCGFDDPNSYTLAELRRMEADGYQLYADGRRTPVRGRKKSSD